MSLVWLITGCSSGFGEEIARYALERGQVVIATARGDAKKRLSSLAEAGAHIASLDVTSSQDEITQTIDELVSEHKRIDVLVNNAGMVQTGCIEELSDAEWRTQFDINIFGLLSVTRAVLPLMRGQKSGTICNIGSQAGRLAFPTVGAYCATKFALEAITESLSAELVDYNIRCIVIEPGDFATKVFASSNTKGPQQRMSDVYRKDIGRDWANDVHNKQRGDTKKGARVIVDALLQTDRPLPLRLALGPDAVANNRQAAQEQLKTLKEWETVSNSTDRDNYNNST